MCRKPKGTNLITHDGDKTVVANQPVLPSQEHPTWHLSGGPVVKTPSSHCRGPKLDLWSGN